MRKISILAVPLALLLGVLAVAGPERAVPAPLFRDPVYDGAADPSLIWNDKERAWWVFYTNRRANDPQAQDGVRWCHGTDIGIASSADGGMTWTYRGIAKGLEFEPGRNTFWAPCLLEHGRVFHMFAAYVRGVPADWSGDRHIVHYTSRDLVNWKFEGIVPLSSERVIDAFVYAKPSGGWRMWYKDEADGSHLYAAASEDLFHWTVEGPVVSGRAQEGPAVFWWRGSYWLLADRWEGMVVLRSDDLEHWTEQPSTILGVPGRRPDDGDIGRHGEVLVQGGRAFLIYFTHPAGKTEHVQPGKHRSSLQAAELEIVDGRLVCDRNKPFSWSLGPPGGFRPAVRPASPLRLDTPDPKLAAAFDWAKGQALDYAFPQTVTGDAVGDWYEAALPGRFAFCMRDVSHQAAGAQVLGLARFNANMFRRFAEALSPARDFCSYWEIDKYNRPAPVDYKNDKDFWYNLPANFDVLDACWRMFLWTGDRTYIDDPAFRNFYVRTVTDHVRTWDHDGDGIPDHRLTDGNRGIGSYDEGDMADRTAVGADLLAAQSRAFVSYSKILRLRGDTSAAPVFEGKAAELRGLFRDKWWDPKLGQFAGLMLQGGKLVDYGSFWQVLFSLYAGLIEPGPARDKMLADLVARAAGNIEMGSYLPEVFYRYGEDKAAYAEILKLSDPAMPRREYPEVSYALVGAIATGLFGIDPDARERVVATRSRLTRETAWAELAGVPVFGNVINVRHDGIAESVLENTSGPPLTWKAMFPGRDARLVVDGTPVEAVSGKDEAGRDISWVLVKVDRGLRKTVRVTPSPAVSNEGLGEKVDAYLQPFVDAGGFSGAVLIAQGGRILLSKGYGLASQEFRVPATPATKFQVASLSKSFTAAAVLILRERGRLDVGDPLTKFMPDYPDGDKITLHHLLTHTSGIPNVNDLPEYDRESRFPQTLERIIALFKNKPLRFEPGAKYEYSNSNYNLLAFIIEKVSGKAYGDFLEETIFKPLRMTDTAHRGRDGAIVPGLAAGYVPAGARGLERAPYLDWTIKTGNGSLYSTVEDLYQWDRALTEGRILSPESRRMMFTDYGHGAGYGWFVGKRSGRNAHRFSGRSPGFTSYLESYPDDRACIVILSNNYAPVPNIAVGGLRAILFGEPYKTLEMDRDFAPDPAALRLCEGRYKFGPEFYRPSAEVEIRAAGEALELVWSETCAATLRPLARDVFLDRTYWANIVFQRDAAGVVKGFIWRDTSEYPAVRLR